MSQCIACQFGVGCGSHTCRATHIDCLNGHGPALFLSSAEAKDTAAELAALRADVARLTSERDEARAAEQLLRDLVNRIHVICEETP